MLKILYLSLLLLILPFTLVTADVNLSEQIKKLPVNDHASIILKRHHASPSPDGRFIVFHGQLPQYDKDGKSLYFENGQPKTKTQLYLSKADGSDERVLVESTVIHAQEPRWSPDGKWIAFVGGKGYGVGEHSLYLIRPDGTNLHVLAESDSGLIKGPTWSPDSSQIAFTVRNVEPTTKGMIHRINIDGTNEEIFETGVEGISDQPRWSLDGKSIYVAWLDKWSGDDITFGLYQFPIVNPSDVKWIITDSKHQIRMVALVNNQDFIYTLIGPDAKGNSDLIWRNMTDNIEVNITNSDHAMEFFPSVSRDGKTLYYDEMFMDEKSGQMLSAIKVKPIKEIHGL